jgi:hypothetical protein
MAESGRWTSKNYGALDDYSNGSSTIEMKGTAW